MSVFRSTADLLTFKAAYAHLVNEGAVSPNGYVNLCEVKNLIVTKPKAGTERHWTYHGDWSKVKSHFNGVSSHVA